MYRLTIALLTLVMTLLAGMSIAQEDDETPWSVFLLEQNTQTIVEITSGQDATSYPLNVFGGNAPILNNAGTAIASCQMQGEPQTFVFTVQDLATSETIYEMTFADTDGCMAGGRFDLDGLVAVGTMTQLTIGDENNLSTFGWSLNLIDLSTDEIVDSLDSSGAEIVNLFGGSRPGTMDAIIPQALSIDGDLVTFRAFPGVGMGGPARLAVYEWHRNADTVIERVNRGILGDDFLKETQQIVTPAFDETLPAADPGGPLPAHNTVVLYTDDEPEVIYTNSEKVILSTTFVNDGDAIAVSLLEGIGSEGLADGIQHINVIIIDLNGELVTEVVIYNGMVSVAAAPGGYVLLLQDTNNPPNAFLDYYNAASEGTRLWSYDASDTTTYNFYSLLDVIGQ